MLRSFGRRLFSPLQPASRRSEGHQGCGNYPTKRQSRRLPSPSLLAGADSSGISRSCSPDRRQSRAPPIPPAAWMRLRRGNMRARSTGRIAARGSRSRTVVAPGNPVPLQPARCQVKRSHHRLSSSDDVPGFALAEAAGAGRRSRSERQAWDRERLAPLRPMPGALPALGSGLCLSRRRRSTARTGARCGPAEVPSVSSGRVVRGL